MKQRNILYLTIVLVLAILAGYVYVSQLYERNPENWSSFLFNMADTFAALLAAIALTAVLLQYHKEDKSYSMWLWFTVGMWAWVFAEATFGYFTFLSGEEPSLGLADMLWFTGYGLISVALYKQYYLIGKIKAGWWKLAAAWAGMLLLVPALLFVLKNEFSTENYIAYLYPVLDFGICLVSFRFYLAFGGAKLSRPWIGLFLLGISDAIWAWVAAGGGSQDSWLSTFGDVSYVAAYLILAVGFLMQYLLLHFGPE